MTTRVLLVVGVVAGGAGAHVQMLAEGLVERGHRVTIACPAEVAASFDLDAVGASVEKLEISSRPAPRADSRTMRKLRLMVADADVVHAHGVRAGAMACLAATTKTPVVVTMHNVAPVHNIANRAVFQSLERVIARRADLVLAVSADLAERISERGAADVRLALVPAPPAPTEVAGRADVRSRLVEAGVRAEGPLAVIVGRLAEQKGLALALDAASDLRDIDLHWAIAGDGPEREKLQHRIDKASLPVTLLGRRDDVPELLAAADVVVSTAEWEGQPVWLQEAIQQGAAIVATDVGGTQAVVGEAAALVKRDPQEVAGAIRDVLTVEGYAEWLRESATRRAGELPTREAALDQVEGIYALVRSNG